MSRKYWITLPGSQWTARETEMLNVQDIVKPWRELLAPDFRNFDTTDPVLAELLRPVKHKARDMTPTMLRELGSSSVPCGSILAVFYDDVNDLVSTIESFDTDSDDIVNEPPLPSHVLKRRRLDRDATSSPVSVVPIQSIPNSTSSISSDERITLESRTERAFSYLLRYILYASMTLRYVESPLQISPDHVRHNIKLSLQHPGCAVVNDGCVRIGRSRTPVINIDCKNRDGSTGYEIYDKIFAQEFAEMLAMMLEREKMLRFENITDAVRVVYSISVHHRKAYLTKVNFPPRYLRAIVNGKLKDEAVVVERSEMSYRLDDVDGLKELITMIHSLFMQLEHEESAGWLMTT